MKPIFIYDPQAKVALIKEKISEIFIDYENHIARLFFSGHGSKSGLSYYDGTLKWKDLYSLLL